EAFLRPDVAEAGFCSFVSVPLESKNRVIGTLDLASRARREFSERDLNMLLAIGHQIGMAVENARLYERVGRLAILEERSRIGMDLHDGVIQSIYAVGLTLESARLALRDDPRSANESVGQAISALNDAIRDIRNFILDLRPQRFEGDLDRGISRLVREFQANALVPVELSVNSEAVARLSPRVAQTLFLTTQEALANVARHARASRVWVGVTQEDGMVKLNISDDGRGFDLSGQPQTVGHGLANMRARAADLQGTFIIESSPGQGTALCLSIPL
ncbi:MAG: GAF domain-containing sensor histidine kinase, partial [Chloroflexi bacterium]|nr:GAF domain-containing sensor histidine kinase [Chloroflexota bacterium]